MKFCLMKSFITFRKSFFIIWWRKFQNVLVFSGESKQLWLLFAVYLCTFMMAISFLYQSPTSYDFDSDVTNMTWSQFEKHCHFSEANSIKRQIMCSQLKGIALIRAIFANIFF